MSILYVIERYHELKNDGATDEQIVDILLAEGVELSDIQIICREEQEYEDNH